MKDFPFISRHAKGSLPGHRHRKSYYAVVVEGKYLERSVDGTFMCRQGMIVSHPAYYWHHNYFHSPGAIVLNVFAKNLTAYIESRVSDYRRVAGVLIPHRYRDTENATDKILSEMTWGKIEANRELPTSWFSPPVFSRTRLQAFMESLYGERTDIDAMMWTYYEFRCAYPEIETRAAVEVVGYQTLKMGGIDQSIALLEANVRDYQDSANSAFGLGQAYVAAEKFHEAREELNRALTLDANHKRSAAFLDANQFWVDPLLLVRHLCLLF